jgi:uncharacterized membrane protein YphA (DoxX/SURF4 family)
MRTNPFSDALAFLLGQTPDHQGSGLGGLLTAVFLLLLAASAAIAWTNWRQDPKQRSAYHLAVCVMRVLIGIMWFQGSIWKLPLPVSPGLQGWTQSLAENAAFEFHRWIAQNVLLPFLVVLGPLVYLTELSLSLSYMLGILVRPLAVVGMLFVAHLWLGLYRFAGEWPWQYIFLIFVQAFFLLDNAGRSLGADALIDRARGRQVLAS